MTTNNPYLTLDQQMVGDIYTTREAMDNLTILCDDFGSRFGGTEGERQAAEFMAAKLEEYGLSNVDMEPVEYTGWVRGQAKLEILSPIHKEIPCISLPHSPAARIEATLIDMGDGAPDAFDERADEIKDKIVMVTSEVMPGDVKRWIHRNEKLGRSILAGAGGFIFVNHYPAYGPATGGIGFDDGEALIPGISIAHEDGAFIKRLIQRKGDVKIRLTTTDHTEPMTSWNIVAEIPGTEKPEEIVMFGCHYDGHDISQGAQDPASGAVAVIEAARVLAKYAGPQARTLRFVLWGIEEIGLLGSQAYAKAHADELDNIRFYLNMDSAGVTSRKDVMLNEWPDLADLFKTWGEEMALDYAVGQSVSAHSDHFPFFMAGVPTGGMQTVRRTGSGGRGYGHTRYDTLDKVELLGLQEAAVLAARLAPRIANAEDWPVSRRDPAEVLELLDSPAYQEEAAYRERIAAHYAEARGQK